MEDFLGEITAIEKKYVAINKQKDFILIQQVKKLHTFFDRQRNDVLFDSDFSAIFLYFSSRNKKGEIYFSHYTYHMTVEH